MSRGSAQPRTLYPTTRSVVNVVKMKTLRDSASSAAARRTTPSAPCALVVDDDRHIASLIEDALSAEGFQVTLAFDGMSALRRAREHDPDIVILDIGLPGLDGLEVCRAIRKDSSAAILFLTARTQEVDRVIGLELGADDYVSKPFSPREIVARVRAIMRRLKTPAPRAAQRRTIGDVSVDAERREVLVDGRAVRLKPREFDLLWLFARNEGRVFTRDQLIEAVWGYDWEGDRRTVDVHVRRIRRALNDGVGGRPGYLQTVHGLGYKMSGPK